MNQVPSILDLGKQLKFDEAREAELLEQVASWTGINFHLRTWSLEEVTRAIYLEATTQSRPRVLRRLLSRKNALQKARDEEDVGI